VKKSVWLSLPIMMLVLLAAPAIPQSRNSFPTPPPSMDPQTPQSPQKDSTTLTRHLDLEQLQREADDLARTAQTIPSDVASVRKGTLPKDVIEKLKQIEKLSKHLRTQLNP
jgi:hypothetical protein